MAFLCLKFIHGKWERELILGCRQFKFFSIASTIHMSSFFHSLLQLNPDFCRRLIFQSIIWVCFYYRWGRLRNVIFYIKVEQIFGLRIQFQTTDSAAIGSTIRQQAFGGGIIPQSSRYQKRIKICWIGKLSMAGLQHVTGWNFFNALGCTSWSLNILDIQ